MKEQIMFRQSAPFVEVLITLQKNVSKESNRKSKNLARMVIQTTDELNGHLENVLDMGLNITYLHNLQSHLKIMRNVESKLILM